MARRLISLMTVAAALAACAPGPPGPDRLTLTRAAYSDLPGWAVDAHSEAIPAFRQTCRGFRKMPASAAIGPAALAGRVRNWRAPCAALDGLPDGDDTAARIFFERWFTPYRAANGNRPEGLFTGYYEPELRGSRVREGRYTVPLYVRPPELVTVDLGRFRADLRGERVAGRVVGGSLLPYPDRAGIEAGALAGRGLELVWVDDAIDAFFLHIQGSGRVVLADGSVFRVGYAASNGHRYKAIGRALIARGAVSREDMSMQAIRAWLARNPDSARALMALNPSFIFFRAIPGAGPIGASGVALTAGRSLAVDRRFIALGLPVWLDTMDPIAPERRLRRLMIAQDAGGAIRGPVRGDVFWGHGEDAAQRAGRMKALGRYYLLIPRTVTVPRKMTVAAN